MIVIIILLVIVAFLLVILSFVWPPDSPWAPQWRTTRVVARRILNLAKVGKNDVLYELGSGDGEVILCAAQEYGARSVGVEIDPVRAFVSWVRIKIAGVSRQVKVIRKDFKKVDISSATVVYMYLIPEGMKRLLPKFREELSPGTKLVSYRYKIPLEKSEKSISLLHEDEKNKIYVYILMTVK